MTTKASLAFTPKALLTAGGSRGATFLRLQSQSPHLRGLVLHFGLHTDEQPWPLAGSLVLASVPWLPFPLPLFRRPLEEVSLAVE